MSLRDVGITLVINLPYTNEESITSKTLPYFDLLRCDRSLLDQVILITCLNAIGTIHLGLMLNVYRTTHPTSRKITYI